MSRYFSFRWRSAPEGPTAVLVVAATSWVFEGPEIISLLDADHQTNLYPDRILFVMPAGAKDAFLAGLSKTLEGKTTLRIDAERVSIYAAPFDADGRNAGFEYVSGPQATWPESPFEKVKTAGLEEIFVRRKVLMRPGAGMHFVHPKGVHSRSFLRGANAFVNGAEIGFVAMTLLHYMHDVPRQIWLDTSSIASVAYAMIALRQQFGIHFEPPHIESFSSYDGLKTVKLSHATRSLFLISATASGDMAREIMDRERVDRRRVINLFSGAPRHEDITVHCNVHGHREVVGADGESLLRVAPADDCPWCRDNSRLLRFVSDQFLADAIKYTPEWLVERDAPPGLARLAGRFTQRQAFTLERRPASAGHRFWINVPKWESEGSLAADVAAAVPRFVPLATTHVVHLDDVDSEMMGTAVADQIEVLTGSRPTLVPAARARDINTATARGAVVTAACIGSGNKLQVVSRDLRDVLDDKPRAYIVGIAKQGEAGRLKSLKNDLMHGKSYRHEFVALHEMTLPDYDLNAWNREFRLLTRLHETQTEPEAIAFIERRIQALGAKRLGAAHDLFLQDPRGNDLALSAGFAFWGKDYDVSKVSHGDVLATIAAILHHMRTHQPKAGIEPKLSATTFHTSVIAPGVFGRYNDGVIQAAILRAAHPHELIYGSRPELSAAMLRIIERTLERWNASQGEACLEFLLALAMKRMILSEPDLKRLAAFPLAADVPPHLRMLRDAATVPESAALPEPDAPP